jgi:hypothetical protein
LWGAGDDNDSSPTDAIAPTASPIGEEPANDGQQEEVTFETLTGKLWLPLSIAGVSISGLFLIVRIYLDFCHSPKVKMLKLPKHSPENERTRPEPKPWGGKTREFQRSKASTADNKSRLSPPRTKLQRSQSGDQVKQMSESLAKKEAPRNRAGENGRGIKASKSLPTVPTQPFVKPKASRRPSNPKKSTDSLSNEGLKEARCPENGKKSYKTTQTDGVPLPLGNSPQASRDDDYDSRSVSGCTKYEAHNEKNYKSKKSKMSPKRETKKAKRALSPKREANTPTAPKRTLTPKKASTAPKMPKRELSPKKEGVAKTPKNPKTPKGTLSPKKETKAQLVSEEGSYCGQNTTKECPVSEERDECIQETKAQLVAKE